MRDPQVVAMSWWGGGGGRQLSPIESEPEH